MSRPARRCLEDNTIKGVDLYTILVFWIPSIFQNLAEIFNIANRYSETDLISERERELEDHASLID